MLRQLIGATAVIVVYAETASAQVIPGDNPATYVYWSEGFSNLHSTEDRWRDAAAEQKYREAVKKIPDRKASNDPWRTIRQAPAAAAPVDRHVVR
jgi:hypothetical protein